MHVAGGPLVTGIIYHRTVMPVTLTYIISAHQFFPLQLFSGISKSKRQGMICCCYPTSTMNTICSGFHVTISVKSQTNRCNSSQITSPTKKNYRRTVMHCTNNKNYRPTAPTKRNINHSNKTIKR